MAVMPLLRVGIVKRNDNTKGFVVLVRRWVVERTFSWFGCYRRLAGRTRQTTVVGALEQALG